MQATSSFVSTLGKFATGVRHGKNDSSGWQVVALIEHGIKRHAPCFIAHGNPTLSVNANPDMFAETSDSFIYSIVQRFPDKVEQTGCGGRTNIHTRTMADGSNAL